VYPWDACTGDVLAPEPAGGIRGVRGDADAGLTIGHRVLVGGAVPSWITMPKNRLPLSVLSAIRSQFGSPPEPFSMQGAPVPVFSVTFATAPNTTLMPNCPAATAGLLAGSRGHPRTSRWSACAGSPGRCQAFRLVAVGLDMRRTHPKALPPCAPSTSMNGRNPKTIPRPPGDPEQSAAADIMSLTRASVNSSAAPATAVTLRVWQLLEAH
jgi:hypothetical protein